MSSGSAPGDPVQLPQPGDRIDKYEVEETLGRGGMGVVVSARHLAVGHRVALKILTAAAESNPVAAARFLREARATIELGSEHVVRVLDLGTLPAGNPFLVMERLEGEDLHRVLQQRGPLPVSEAVDYILQAADGLAEAHAKGIVHRDLKPSNLFLTRRADGEALVKVLDFGISKLAPLEGEGELTETQSLLGSPAYMAPEQVRSARKVDSRADVWGLGIVLYRLLTRKNPFSGEGVIELCSAILTQAPVKPTEVRPELPKDLEAVILKCLEKEPAARYQSVQELARALAPFAPESSMSMRFLSARLQPIAAVESVAKQDVTHDAVQLPARPTQKSRVLLALAVTALTTFAVLGFFLTRHPMQPIEPPPREAELAKHAESAKVVPVESASQTAAPSPSPSTSASAAQSATTKAPKVGKPSVKSATSPSWGKLIDDPL